LTASGQPISRQILQGDTISIFSIKEERRIAYDLQMGVNCSKAYNQLYTTDSLKSVKIRLSDSLSIVNDSIIIDLKKVNSLYKEEELKNLTQIKKYKRIIRVLGVVSGGLVIIKIFLLPVR
jgi:hypothetical protein